MRLRHAYGPVPSRRYGLSLGVDVLPAKVCSLDCAYCQCGPTTRLSVTRETFFPVEAIVADVVEALRRGPRPEILTLAGSGEPTLYAGLADLVDALHDAADLPVLVLTNGSLLHLPDVRADLRRVDLVVPSLDAGDPETWRRVNGPHPALDFDSQVEGLRRFCAEHPGRIRLEVMLVKGINDSPAQLAPIIDLARSLGVEGVDVNTPVRPARGRRVVPLDGDTLVQVASLFGPLARAAVPVRRRARSTFEEGSVAAAVLDLVARRPCTRQDMGDALGVEQVVLDKVLMHLLAEERVREEARSDGIYFLGT